MTWPGLFQKHNDSVTIQNKIITLIKLENEKKVLTSLEKPFCKIHYKMPRQIRNRKIETF